MSTETSPAIGDSMPDGTVYAGISPETNEPMYALPADAPLAMNWKRAIEYAAEFEGYGHPKGTFRVPTKDELQVLFRNRANIGRFNETGKSPASWYWSSTRGRTDQDYDYAASTRFDDGFSAAFHHSGGSAVRLVRS